MGMHLNVPDSVPLDPVAREHRHRVWWTAYIYDRMWSAILGYPHAISDEAIKVDLPADTDDSSNSGNFSERAHFVARISLSRLSAHVVRSIYGPAVQETPLPSRVHSVFTDLRKWLEDLPAFLKVDTRRMIPLDPRASSLQLMFNQVRITIVCALSSADFDNDSLSSLRPAQYCFTFFATVCHPVEARLKSLTRLWRSPKLAYATRDNLTRCSITAGSMALW